MACQAFLMQPCSHAAIPSGLDAALKGIMRKDHPQNSVKLDETVSLAK